MKGWEDGGWEDGGWEVECVEGWEDGGWEVESVWWGGRMEGGR